MKAAKLEKLAGLIAEAKESSFKLWMLNELMAYSIPFNKPHGFKITTLKDGQAEIGLRYKKINQNFP